MPRSVIRRTRRAFGAIRKLPSGRYQASYNGPDAVRHVAPHTFAAKMDADAWLNRQRVAAEEGTWAPPRSPSAALTFADYADDWLAQRNLKPNTRIHYRWLLGSHIFPTFAEASLQSISTATVRAWHANVNTGRTAKAHCYALLKSILSAAVEDELITVNPCRIKGVASKADRRREIRPASLAELEAITAAVPERLQLLIHLSAWCALRFGEVTELRRRDIDVEVGVIRVRRGVTRPGGQVTVDTPKTAAGARDVHIPPHLIPAVTQHLREHAQRGVDGLLFYASSGRHLAHSSLLYHFQRASAVAGRDDLTPHALRHTGAVLAAQSGATLAELMARLGHTTPEMAMRYQHASAQRDLILAQRLSDLANAPEG